MASPSPSAWTEKERAAIREVGAILYRIKRRIQAERALQKAQGGGR